MRRVLCISCLLVLLIGGCVAPPIAETWEGYRVTKDIPIDVSKPKLGNLPQAEILRYEVSVYRTKHWPWGMVHY